MIKSETLLIDGAVGPLEVLFELPDSAAQDSAAQSIALVCHPHPLFQGTMHNKVAYMLARSLLQNNAIAVRFNFRGVGQSAGVHADGIGEVDDVVSVLKWLKQRWPDLPVTLCGFSFGAYVALSTAQDSGRLQDFTIDKLITVAPPVGRWDFSAIHAPDIPWLVIQGTEDDLVDAKAVEAWCSALDVPPVYTEVKGADHFFHGKLSLLRQAVHAWLESL